MDSIPFSSPDQSVDFYLACLWDYISYSEEAPNSKEKEYKKAYQNALADETDDIAHHRAKVAMEELEECTEVLASLLSLEDLIPAAIAQGWAWRAQGIHVKSTRLATVPGCSRDKYDWYLSSPAGLLEIGSIVEVIGSKGQATYHKIEKLHKTTAGVSYYCSAWAEPQLFSNRRKSRWAKLISATIAIASPSGSPEILLRLASLEALTSELQAQVQLLLSI